MTTPISFDVRAQFTARGAEPFDVSVSLSVESGETLVLLGPSGSGKTLLLECLGGFHDHDGSVNLDDRDVTSVPPEDRDFGFVFQEYALFPHLTVRENAAFGLRYHDETRDPADLLSTLGVSDLADRTPVTLSGGEKQRVALARALAIDPSILLLDEPLAALDAPTRRRLRDDLADVLSERTSIYVTHDRTTARALGDRIGVMSDGEVHQVGTPEAVFERPDSAFVAEFVGANVVSASVVGGATGEQVAVRPEHVALGSTDDGESALSGEVTRVLRAEMGYRVVVGTDAVEIVAYTDDPPAVGASVGVSFPRGTTPLSE